MDRVFAKLQALPGVEDFDEREPANGTVVATRLEDDLRAKLFDPADGGVAGHADVAGQQPNLR